MVIKIVNFDKSGKQEGPGVIMWDDEVRFALIKNEANGGFTMQFSNGDEFGNEQIMTLTFDKFDIEQLKPWTK